MEHASLRSAGWLRFGHGHYKLVQLRLVSSLAPAISVAIDDESFVGGNCHHRLIGRGFCEAKARSATTSSTSPNLRDGSLIQPKSGGGKTGY